MNDLAKVSRNGRHRVVSLPEDFEVEGSALRVRRDGRNIVLEPIEPPGIPPGYYTPETLPPLSEGARKILASIDAVAPFVDVRGGDKSADDGSWIEIEDDGVGIGLSDEGHPGLDPDN